MTSSVDEWNVVNVEPRLGVAAEPAGPVRGHALEFLMQGRREPEAWQGQS